MCRGGGSTLQPGCHPGPAPLPGRPGGGGGARVNAPIPRWLLYTAAVVTALALVPFALIVRARSTTSPDPRIHIVPDMDRQPFLKAQSANPLFADGRAMRPPVAGTMARGELREDEAVFRG
ncbi:hypothetical protein RZS08_23025, partial [Arthrospira platensis SPKY1]|nr:hypothetical protein [Arthrospira platensis SPKY1]